MIKLTKGAVPASLAANGTTWRNEILAHHAAGTDVPDALASNYNQGDVKSALETECHKKCMYCESKIAHVTFAHIEHYKPKKKSMFPELTFEWTNLGIACPRCNLAKHDKFDTAVPFINPYVDDPKVFFRAEGAFVRPVPGDTRAELTEFEIELNRAELVERRQDRLKDLRRLIACYNRETHPKLKAALLQQIKDEVKETSEYSFVASTHAALFV